mmetsp:Transcript_10021/g.20647  ORF Transcript_10021/g.20647 Transcript_10021/m.20647 type:complete len:308 (-) Transcript_10021:144-1067(-)
MSTRVTSSIASRRARETLVRLLFPNGESSTISSSLGTGPSSSPSWKLNRTIDVNDNDRHNHKHRAQSASTYSRNFAHANKNKNQTRRHTYSQLRAAYIEKVHLMHPDKIAHQREKPKDEEEFVPEIGGAEAHQKFIELKNAWEEYDASMRLIRQHSQKNSNIEGEDFWDEEQDNFTTFGVGCSFADTPRERELRNEIMEQACRGWFSFGELASVDKIQPGNSGTDASGESNTSYFVSSSSANLNFDRLESMGHRIKLSDDGMFVPEGEKDNEESEHGSENNIKRENNPTKKSLVQNLGKFQRRRRKS